MDVMLAAGRVCPWVCDARWMEGLSTGMMGCWLEGGCAHGCDSGWGTCSERNVLLTCSPQHHGPRSREVVDIVPHLPRYSYLVSAVKDHCPWLCLAYSPLPSPCALRKLTDLGPSLSSFKQSGLISEPVFLKKILRFDFYSKGRVTGRRDRKIFCRFPLK